MARRSAEVPRAAGKVSALQVARIFSTRRRGGAEKNRDIGSSGDREIVKATTACFTSRDLKRHACGSRSAPSPGVTDRYASMPGSVISTGAPRRFCSFKKISGAEWRDPEGVSSAMPLQGVLPRSSTSHAVGLEYSRAFTDYRTADGNFPPGGHRDRTWGELPGTASSGTHSRDPSTPRPSFPGRRNPQRRFAQDDTARWFIHVVTALVAFCDLPMTRSPDHPITRFFS